jgi:hypothetical protein
LRVFAALFRRFGTQAGTETSETRSWSARSVGRPHQPIRFTEFDMHKFTRTLAAAASLGFGLAAHAQSYDPKATIADLDARLAKIGAPSIQGTDPVAGKTVPAIFFGDRKINNNYDVVDAVRKAHNATATVFVKDGDEYIRVSTNVLTPEGKRGIGTQLARNAAYETVSKGQMYCGPIDVLGTAFDSCYNPIRDGGGKVIGLSYIGHKK